MTKCSLVPEDTKALAITHPSATAATPGPTTRRHARLGSSWSGGGRRNASRAPGTHGLPPRARDRGERYRAFVAALADEERAATEVERIIDLAEARQCTTTIDARNRGLGAG